MQKVGLLGGTFDPPHYGHLMIAEEVLEALDLDEVWFIPSNEPPHKEKSDTKVEYRVEMLQAAIEDNTNFKVNQIELKRSGKSYTVDTIKLLREQYPEITFYFIIGADMVEYLPNWYKIDELSKLVQFVGVKRSDYQLKSNYPVVQVNIPGVDISSTLIRERLSEGKSIRYFLPESVIDVIKEHQIYGSK
ncbi:nicotinate-nucleotide adenylyltransferase [Radiobacillus sp. PE A8.2]|uniref:nicotinate-nucleotide adenylyltransferase n=1 Tax=Radiobacillus sp. PE A8.2 TaxID=3380349 RepID=UPI003890DDF1